MFYEQKKPPKQKEREKCCVVNKRTIRLSWGEKKKSAYLQFKLLSTADQAEFCCTKDQKQEPRQDWAVCVEGRGKAKGMTSA